MYRLRGSIAPVLVALVVLALAGRPAAAAIDFASGHYIVPNWSMQLCRSRVQSGLQAEHLDVVENVANTGDFRGYSNVRKDAEGPLDAAGVNCWPTNGGMRVTFDCASQIPNNHAVDLCNRLIGRVIYNQPGPSSSCSSPVGTWKWWNGGTATFGADGSASLSDPYGSHRGKWERTNDGRFHVHWDYPTDDYFTLAADGRTMTGNFNGNNGTSTRQGGCGNGLR